MSAPLTPKKFERGPLADLVQALADADAGDVSLVAADAVPHRPDGRRAGITTALGDHRLDTRPAETRLPLDHPEIHVRGVALEDYLGGGGQGWVYTGRVQSTNKLVAVKVLSRGRDSLDWGAREAILCARVRHPNVLRVLRAEPAGAFWVVLMELVLGDDLGRERVQESAARTCFGQLCDALNALASHRLVHRDIKPANVLLRRDDHSPVLIDFGLAVDFGETAEGCDLSGTPFFLPPEAWRDEPVSPAWDAYALGVTAAIALAGTVPMPTDLPSLRDAKLSGVFERRLDRALESSPLRNWIADMTSPEPARRLAAVETARAWN